MKKSSNIIWGIVLVIIGGIFTLNALEITNIDLFFDGWWTLFIIIPSFVGLFTSHDKTGCLIGLSVGTFLLLCFQGILSFDMLWKLALPVIIVIIGIRMILTGIFGPRGADVLKNLNSKSVNFKNSTATFSEANLNFCGEVFSGAELNAVFGGVKCDLREAVIDQDCVINCSAIFGGVDIFVPENVNVKIYSNSIFGGVSDKRRNKSKNNPYTVYINSTCMFGGVDIR